MDSFSPMESEITRYPIHQLSDITSRARQILVGKSSDEVRWAQAAVDDWVDAYFSDEVAEDADGDDGEIPHEVDPFSRDEIDDERYVSGGRVLSGLAMADARGDHVPTWLNTSWTRALEACIDWFFDETEREFRGWKAEHFFASLALSYVESAESGLLGISQKFFDDRSHERMEQSHAEMVRRAGKRGHPKLSSILQSAYWRAIEATEALRIAERRIANSEKRQLQHGLALTVDRAKTEVHHSEQVRRQAGAQRALAKRHEKTNEARSLVCLEWNKDRCKFPSAEQAGDFYSDWLETRGFSYRQRTVRDWIRAYAKAAGVAFR